MKESPQPKRERRLPQARPGPIVRTYHKPRQARASEKGTHGRLVPEAGQIGEGVDLMQPPALPRRVPMGNDPDAQAVLRLGVLPADGAAARALAAAGPGGCCGGALTTRTHGL